MQPACKLCPVHFFAFAAFSLLWVHGDAYWTGAGEYPSVKVRMDFRGPLAGDFVYHCHILGHEDNGMMAIIRVLPPPPSPRK